jgi:hypothetical protein
MHGLCRASSKTGACPTIEGEANMRSYLKNFLRRTDGAVTVDWVVLTAAIVGLAISAIAATKSGVNQAATTIKQDLANTATSTE